MPASVKIPATFTAVDKFSHVIKGMGREIRNMTRTGISHIKRFDHRVSQTFKKLGRLTQLALGVGLGALFLNAVDDIKTFETNLVGVGKTTGMAGAELYQLGQDTIAASKTLRGIETNKLLELGMVAGQLGITGSKNILNFSTTLAKLEKATDIVGEEGASSIARLLNITGEGPAQVDRFGASLVALGNSTAATESQILAVASEVGRATAAYKLNSREILGVSAALADMGVAPEAAGTAIAKTFMGIEKATISGGKMLTRYAKLMGMSAKETKDLFATDKQATFNKLIGGLNKIQKEGGSVTKAMDDIGLSGIILNKGIIPLVSNYDKLEGKLKLANDEYKRNQALNEETAAASKTVQTGLDEVAKSFANVLTSSATAGSGLDIVRETLFFIADNMETVVALGAVLLGSFIALKVATGIISAIEVATKLWTGAQWLLNIAMDANPIGLIIIAVAALVALIVGAIQKYDEWGAALLNFMGPIGILINLFMSFKRHWDSIVEAFQTEGIVGGIKRIGQVIWDSMLYPLEQFLRMVSKIPGVGKIAQRSLAFVSAARQMNNLNQPGEFAEDRVEPVDSPAVNQAQSDAQTRAAMLNGTVNLNIKDPGNHVEKATSEGPMPIPINISNTQGAF